jgi:type I restriction-modification system DNA methylase subunit
LKSEDHKKIIADMIVKISGHKSPYQVFYDWCACMAMAFQNSCDMFKGSDIYKQREELYQSTIKQYTQGEQDKLYEMTARLFLAFEDEIFDYLGGIYMEAGCGNKYVGQFFTPFHLSELCAKLGVDGTDKIYHMNEPSCGGGAMILATAKALKDIGINYQRKLKVVAQDLDWLGVYMTYVQCYIIGIDAIVVQGDTLAEPYTKNYPKSRTLRTLNNMGGLI